MASWVSVKEIESGNVVTGLVDGFDGYVRWKDEYGHAHKTPCMWENRK